MFSKKQKLNFPNKNISENLNLKFYYFSKHKLNLSKVFLNKNLMFQKICLLSLPITIVFCFEKLLEYIHILNVHF